MKLKHFIILLVNLISVLLIVPTVFAAQFLDKNEVSINGITLRDTTDKVYAELGEPNGIERNQYGTYHNFHGLYIQFDRKGEVYSIRTENSSYQTPRGIAVGDDIEKAKVAYGSCLSKSSYKLNGLIPYRCGTSGMAFMMSFLTNDNGFIVRIELADQAKP